MDWTEKRQCVLCNRGGKLLVCSDEGCPISVHKSCMGCEARFDDVGNFHCPYCVYKRLAAETCQLREKAILAKKGLSKFLDEEMKDDSHNKKEKNSLRDDVQYQSIHLEKHQHSKIPGETRETIVSEKTDGLSDRLGEISGLDNVNTCKIMVVYEAISNPVDDCGLDHILDKEHRKKTDEPKSNVSKRVRVENQTGKVKCKFNGVEDQQHASSIEEGESSCSLVKKITHKKRSHSVAFNKNGNKTKEERMMEPAAKTCVSSSKSNREIDKHGPKRSLDHRNGPTKGSLEERTGAASCPEIIKIGNPGELEDSSKQLSVINRSVNPALQIGKRRVHWSDEEEDMLKEGVQKFSLVSRKNIPWKKILEFGRHVFDASRTPSDLKDKWRNMAK